MYSDRLENMMCAAARNLVCELESCKLRRMNVGAGNPSPKAVGSSAISGLVALIVPVILAVAAFRYASHHGSTSEIEEFIQRGVKIARTGHDYSAFYPPLIPYIVATLISVGLPHGPEALTVPVIGLAGVSLLWACQTVIGSAKKAWLAWALVFLNPYLIWNLILSKDTAYELLFLSLATGAAFKGYLAVKQGDRATLWWVVAGVSGALLVVTRVTGLLEILLLLAAIVYAFRGKNWRGPAITAALVLGSCLLLAVHNKQSVGKLTLATNGGVNLYFGNHPRYLNGHPLYDIDAFLEPEVTADPASKLATEVERDDAFKQEAFQFIRHDKAAFVFRAIAKSEWFWINTDKIPALSSDAELTNAETGDSKLGGVRVMPSLIYAFYRIPTLFFLILGTVLILLGALPRRLLLLYMPMIGLWPVCVMTFPDTRFKLAPESLLTPVVALGMVWAVEQWKKRKTSQKAA